MAGDLEERFQDAFARWQQGTQWASSLTEIDAHPARAEIVELGRGTLKLLLDELERRPSVGLFPLLTELSGVDPAEGETTVKGAAAKWLAWDGRR